MYLTTANIKNREDLPRPEVREDARTVTRMGQPRHARAVLLQEIGMGKGRRDEADVRSQLPEGWALAGPEPHLKTTPIAVSATFTVLDAGWYQISADPGDELPDQSERGLTWAAVRLETRDKLPPFILTSTHYINGGWTPSKGKNALRRAYWRDARENERELVRGWNRDGLTVIGGGDYNRRGWEPDFTRDTLTIHSQGLDYLHASPAPRGVQIAGVSDRMILEGRQNNTDHPFVGAAVRLARP